MHMVIGENFVSEKVYIEGEPLAGSITYWKCQNQDKTGKNAADHKGRGDKGKESL